MGGAVALLIACVAALFWPGVPMYDTVAQYRQVIGDLPVDDWHPPVMVRLWQALHPLAGGTAPMFVLQVGLYALGFGLIVAALLRAGRSRSAAAAAIFALSPLLLGWQMVVLKDAQMLGALLGAVGVIAHYRLGGRTVALAHAAMAGILIAYATLVRANAIFATAPLTALLLSPTRNRALLAAGLAFAAMPAFIALAPVVNHDLFRAEPSDVAKSEPIFDLAGIAVRAPEEPSSPFTSDERAEIIARHCSKAYFWDSLADPTACAGATERLMEARAGQLYFHLAREAARHPAAYAGHRLAHWNSTERWLVPRGLPDAGPPDEAEPNDLGLVGPASPTASNWQQVAAAEAATPLGWPVFWTATALMLLPFACRLRPEPAGSLALALVASAVTLEASFLVISIASDLRYHVWSMAASALALVLLLDRIEWRSRWTIAGAGLLIVIAATGTYARWILPPAPDSYEGMISTG